MPGKIRLARRRINVSLGQEHWLNESSDQSFCLVICVAHGQVGHVPADVVKEASCGHLHVPWPAQLNRLVWEGGHDLILSIGQVGGSRSLQRNCTCMMGRRERGVFARELGGGI